MNGTAALEAEIEAVRGRLAAAKVQADAGAVVELGGLEDRVARLAAALGALSPAEAGGFKPRLLALLDDIDRLAAAMTAHHRALKDALSGISEHKRAATAYGPPEPDRR